MKMEAEEIAKEHIYNTSGNDDYYIPERIKALAKDIKDFAKQGAVEAFEAGYLRGCYEYECKMKNNIIPPNCSNYINQKYKQDENNT